MRRFGFIAVVVALSLLAAAPVALAEKRIALLIGNQSYTSEIGRLANPHNDIALLEKALKALQFEVTSVRDAGLAALHQAVNAYARRVKAAGPNAVGFFYYAGHGAADGSTNYLIPVDVKSVEEGELWDVSLRLTEITAKLKKEAGNATHFVVFDACRNTLKLRTAGSRALVQSRGFVPVAQESGMLVAYATAEGELASDVGAGAGPYSSVLAEEIVKPGVEAVTMFRNVQRRVRAAIKQEPYLGFNALGDVYLAGLALNPPKTKHISEAGEAWGHTQNSKSIAELETFARRFGDTYYGDLAKMRLDELRRAETAKVTAASKKVDEEERATMEHAKEAAEAERQLLKQIEENKRVREERKRLAMLQEEQDAKRQQREAKRELEDVKEGERRLQEQIEENNRKRDEAKRKAHGQTARRDPAQSVTPGSGQSFRDCPDCPEMVLVPEGSFMMGSPAGEEGRFDNEGPQRKVTIARPFAVGKYEVTFAEWDACVAAGGCKHNPNDQGWGRGKRPVINVSWDDITKEYLPWLSRKTGKSYRLLTEAEWEYAARAGTTTPFSTGRTIKTEQANFNGNFTYGGDPKGVYREKTVDVGTFRPNAFGLHDMPGNVWEGVQDCWHDSYQGAPTDGSAWTTSCTESGRRVLRGGSWSGYRVGLRSAFRDWDTSGNRSYSGGFRIGRTLTP